MRHRFSPQDHANPPPPTPIENWLFDNHAVFVKRFVKCGVWSKEATGQGDDGGQEPEAPARPAPRRMSGGNSTALRVLVPQLRLKRQLILTIDTEGN